MKKKNEPLRMKRKHLKIPLSAFMQMGKGSKIASYNLRDISFIYSLHSSPDSNDELHSTWFRLIDLCRIIHIEKSVYVLSVLWHLPEYLCWSTALSVRICVIFHLD